MNITQTTNVHPRKIAHPFDMFRRRHHAAQRMEPDPAGQRDPLKTSIRPTTNTLTVIELARVGGLLTREQYRAAWYCHPEHRDMLDAVAAVQHEGWGDAQ